MNEQQFQAEVMDELKQKETQMTDFNTLRKISVNEHTEKKGNLTYLSWAWAVDSLLQHDPMATWEFPEPKYFGETMMVYCNVTALGKTMKMQLPVMDNRNNAIINPDSRKISDASMRCLAKCIACFGIGLYIYAGEDLPEEEPVNWIELINESKSLEELQAVYTKAYTANKDNKATLKTITDVKDAAKIKFMKGAENETAS